GRRGDREPLIFSPQHWRNAMPRLQDRVALVTGGGRGIGRAMALALGGAGAKVAITARTGEGLHDVANIITGRGGKALIVTADLAERNAPARVVSEVVAGLGPVDILVNNAGIGSSSNPKPVVNFDDAFWDVSLAVNLTAPYLLCKAALPHMLQRRWGR